MSNISKMTELYRDWHEKLLFGLYAYWTCILLSIGATTYSLIMEWRLCYQSYKSWWNQSWMKLRGGVTDMISLNFTEQKRFTTLCYGQCYQKRMAWAYEEKDRPRSFKEGNLALKKIHPLKDDFDSNLILKVSML